MSTSQREFNWTRVCVCVCNLVWVVDIYKNVWYDEGWGLQKRRSRVPKKILKQTRFIPGALNLDPPPPHLSAKWCTFIWGWESTAFSRFSRGYVTPKRLRTAGFEASVRNWLRMCLAWNRCLVMSVSFFPLRVQPFEISTWPSSGDFGSIYSPSSAQGRRYRAHSSSKRPFKGSVISASAGWQDLVCSILEQPREVRFQIRDDGGGGRAWRGLRAAPVCRPL